MQLEANAAIRLQAGSGSGSVPGGQNGLSAVRVHMLPSWLATGIQTFDSPVGASPLDCITTTKNACLRLLLFSKKFSFSAALEHQHLAKATLCACQRVQGEPRRCFGPAVGETCSFPLQLTLCFHILSLTRGPLHPSNTLPVNATTRAV